MSCVKFSPARRTPKKSKYKAGDFSYNTGKLRCPTCDGTGSISLDVQFLPDVNIPCPDCRGSRYGKDASKIRCVTKSGEAYTLPEIMDMDVRTALSACKDWKLVSQRLNVLNSSASATSRSVRKRPDFGRRSAALKACE